MHIKAGVIGYPVKHSKSPLIHNHWIAHHGLHGEYDAVEIAPAELEDAIGRLIAGGYAGFNVTVPHKQAVMALCDTVDETARAIGAVNTIVIADGRLHGFNTDAFGFIENLHQSSFGVDFLHRPAVVLGAGGAARAVVYALAEAGAGKIIILNRSGDKADAVATLAPHVAEARRWEERDLALDGAGLLVNTTSLGMSGQPSLDIDLARLPREAAVCDIVYAPLMTDLLLKAQAHGNQVVTGIGMLLHQARPAFEKWFGVLPDVTEELEKKVLA